MSGFCGWAVALCVDTWKLPGTWGRDASFRSLVGCPRGGGQVFTQESDRSGSGSQRGPSHGTLEDLLPFSEPQVARL